MTSLQVEFNLEIYVRPAIYERLRLLVQETFGQDLFQNHNGLVGIFEVEVFDKNKFQDFLRELKSLKEFQIRNGSSIIISESGGRNTPRQRTIYHFIEKKIKVVQRRFLPTGMETNYLSPPAVSDDSDTEDR